MNSRGSFLFVAPYIAVVCTRVEETDFFVVGTKFIFISPTTLVKTDFLSSSQKRLLDQSCHDNSRSAGCMNHREILVMYHKYQVVPAKIRPCKSEAVMTEQSKSTLLFHLCTHIQYRQFLQHSSSSDVECYEEGWKKHSVYV